MKNEPKIRIEYPECLLCKVEDQYCVHMSLLQFAQGVKIFVDDIPFDNYIAGRTKRRIQSGV